MDFGFDVPQCFSGESKVLVKACEKKLNGMFMKTIYLIALVPAVVLAAACNTSRNAASANDDVYYSARNTPQAVYKSPVPAPSSPPVSNAQESNKTAPPRSQSQFDYAENKPAATPQQSQNFSMDDYYDYSYAARLRRFNTSYTTGIGYYDPYYTNIYYYDYNPVSFGTSIYTTYSFWSPGYTTYVYSRPFGWGMGMGYGYSYAPRFSWDPFGGWNSYWYGYNPYWSLNNPWYWTSPYYSCWNSPWYWYNGWGNYGWGWNNGFRNGYNQGYMNGYWNGYHNGLANSYYYNSYDRNRYYYGRRNSIGNNSVNGGGRNGRLSFGEKYERAQAVDKGEFNSPRNNESGPVIRENAGGVKPFDKGSMLPSREEGGIKNPAPAGGTIRPGKEGEGMIGPSVKPNSNFDYLVPSKSPDTGMPVKTPEGGIKPSFDIRPVKPAETPVQSPGGIKPSFDTRPVKPMESPVQNPGGIKPSFDTRPDKPVEGPMKNPDRNDFSPAPSGGFKGDTRPSFTPDTRQPDYGNPQRFDTKPNRDQFIRDFNNPQGPGQIERDRMNAPVSPRIESSPRYEAPKRDFSPRYEAPRQEFTPRNESPRMENSPRYDSPRMESPGMQSSPRFDAPRMESPRMQSSPRMESGPRMSAPSMPRSSPSGGFSPSGSGGGRRR